MNRLDGGPVTCRRLSLGMGDHPPVVVGRSADRRARPGERADRSSGPCRGGSGRSSPLGGWLEQDVRSPKDRAARRRPGTGAAWTGGSCSGRPAGCRPALPGGLHGGEAAESRTDHHDPRQHTRSVPHDGVSELVRHGLLRPITSYPLRAWHDAGTTCGAHRLDRRAELSLVHVRPQTSERDLEARVGP